LLEIEEIRNTKVKYGGVKLRKKRGRGRRVEMGMGGGGSL